MPTSLTLPLMTAEQFFELPEPVGDFTWELHFGELIQVGRPKKKHFNLQRSSATYLRGSLDGSSGSLKSKCLMDLRLATMFARPMLAFPCARHGMLCRKRGI